MPRDDIENGMVLDCWYTPDGYWDECPEEENDEEEEDDASYG